MMPKWVKSFEGFIVQYSNVFTILLIYLLLPDAILDFRHFTMKTLTRQLES